MIERFDTWKGFLDAGFVADDAGTLHLGDYVAEYVVSKDGGEIKVRFESEVPGFECIEFEMPLEFSDMWDWTAHIAGHTFGTRQNWTRFFDMVTDAPDQDLMQLVEIGLDHLDEDAPSGEDGEKAPGDIRQENEDSASPSDEENDVVSEVAISEDYGDDAERESWSRCLCKVVDAALEESWRVLSDSAQARDIERSQAVMDRVNRLKALGEKIVALAEEWKALGLEDKVGKTVLTLFANSETSARGDEDVASQVGARGTARPAKSGGASNGSGEGVDSPAPKGALGFAVTFEDGVRISEAKASVTFAKAIEKIGAERVAALGFKMADDPIVTRDRSEIKKMPMMVQSIADGWFVKTHSNTYTKMEFLRRMADALNVKLTFERFRRESVAMPTKKRGRGRPPKKPLRAPEKFQIGRVVRWAFPQLFEKGTVSDAEIALFLSDESKRKFGTRGYPVLKETDGRANDYIVNGQRRYYADIRLEHKDRVYLLTSQFITADAAAILSWLETKGFSRSDMDRVGRGEKTVPSLFPEITAFESDPIREEPRQEPKSETAVPAPFALTSDAEQPSLFDRVETKDVVAKTPSS